MIPVSTSSNWVIGEGTNLFSLHTPSGKFYIFKGSENESIKKIKETIAKYFESQAENIKLLSNNQGLIEEEDQTFANSKLSKDKIFLVINKKSP